MAIESPISYRLQPVVFQPINPASYFNRQLPTAPTVKADNAAGAVTVGAMMKVLGELPSQLQDEYEKGKKRALGGQVQQAYRDSLSNKSGSQPLSNFSASSDGTVKFQAQDPLDQELKKGRLDYQDAQIDYLNRKPTSTQRKQSTYDAELQSFNLPQDSQASVLSENGPLGKVTMSVFPASASTVTL